MFKKGEKYNNIIMKKKGQIIVPAKFVSTLVVITIATIMIAILFKAGAFITIASYNKTQIEKSVACDIAYLFSTWKNATEYPAILSERKLNLLNESYLENRLFDKAVKYFFNPKYDFAIYLSYNNKNFSWYFPMESKVGFETCAKEYAINLYFEYLDELQRIFFPTYQIAKLLSLFYQTSSYSKVIFENNLSCELPAFIATSSSQIPEIGKIRVFYFENIATKLRNGFFQTIVNNNSIWFEELGKYPEGCIDASFFGLPIHIHIGPINIDYDIGRLGCGFFWDYDKNTGVLSVFPSKSGYSECVIKTRFPSYYYKNSSIRMSERICDSKIVALSLLQGFIAENKEDLYFFLKFYVLREEGDNDTAVCYKLCRNLYGENEQEEHCKRGCEFGNKTLDLYYAFENCSTYENNWMNNCLNEIKNKCYSDSNCEYCVESTCLLDGSCDLSNPSISILESCYSYYIGESPCKDYKEYCKQGAKYYFKAREIKEGFVDAIYFAVLEDKLKNRDISEIPEKEYDWNAGSICKYEGCSSSLECGPDKICVSGECVAKDKFKSCEFWDSGLLRNVPCSPDYAPEYSAESNLFTYQKVYNLTWPYASKEDNTEEFCECLPNIEYRVNRVTINCSKEPNGKGIWYFSIPKFRNQSLTLKVWVNSDHKKIILLNETNNYGTIEENLCRGGKTKNGLNSFFLQVFFKERKFNFSYILPLSIIRKS